MESKLGILESVYIIYQYPPWLVNLKLIYSKYQIHFILCICMNMINRKNAKIVDCPHDPKFL